MAKKLDSPTSLTEFAPLTPEGDAKPFSFISFFKKANKDKAAPFLDVPYVKDAEDSIQDESSNSSVTTLEKENAFSFCEPSENQDDEENISTVRNRNITSVLEMVKSIVEGKKMGSYSYKDSDFKQYWMPDSNCKECYECGDKFTTFRRRHHCRICGQIFCRRCCSQGIPGNLIGYSGDLRVCSYCYQMLSSCMQSLESDSVLLDAMPFCDVEYGEYNMKNQTERSSSSIQSASNSCRRKSSVVGFREEVIAKANPSKCPLEDFCCDVKFSNSVASRPDLSYGLTCLSDLYQQLLVSASVIRVLIDESQTSTQVQYVRGCDIVEWLLSNNPDLSRIDAVNIGQAFMDGHFIECEIISQKHFTDSDILYKLKMVKPKVKRPSSAEVNHESMEPLWVKEIQSAESLIGKDTDPQSPPVCSESSEALMSRSRSRFPSSSSSFYLDLNVKESTVRVSRPLNKQEMRTASENCTVNSPKETDDLDTTEYSNHARYLKENFPETFETKEILKGFNVNCLTSANMYHFMKEENIRRNALEELNSDYEKLETDLLKQLLQNDKLSSSWCDIILPILHHVTKAVHPDVKNDVDSMDIRQYVQFKKIPGGSKAECTIAHGVVFSKSVAHRKMRQYIHQPTILLLSSPITYQRTENKLSSLDPVIMQEYEYLKNTIGKLTVYKPDVLLVERSVSRLAQEMLLKLGITVALNVKPTVMERVARCTQAAIVSTVDAHLGKPQLGTCQAFRVKTFSIPGGKGKTLMYLDGCPTDLGCTILLRGGSENELKKVKHVVQFMLYVAYNWSLEKSFLKDEFAVLPHFGPKLSFGYEDIEPEISSVDLFAADKKQSLKLMNESYNSESKTELQFDMQMQMNHKRVHSGLDIKSKSKYDESSRKLKTRCIDDFSDPLHSYLQLEKDFFSDASHTKLEVNNLPAASTFHKLLDNIILCCSLNVKIDLPYLETDVGKHCALRKFFPDELYWSEHFSKESLSKNHILHESQITFDEENEATEIQVSSRNVEVLQSHPFIFYKITDVSNMSLTVNSLLSDYRAHGGTLQYQCRHKCACKSKEKKSQNNRNSSEMDVQNATEISTTTGLCWERRVDALDPYKHQKLAVLFCSYSCSSNNAPNYCVNPWTVKMDFYGANDIPFGGFLEKYCFRSSYVCPSITCDTKMTDHVRKFVHGTGCVHILLHELSSGIKTSDSILMWSWCHKCKQASSVVPMSHETWSFSFAKYLELRFYASSYVRRSGVDLCSHSLHHDHYQYFAHKQTVAIFEYNTIVLWEIVLPSVTIAVHDEAVPMSSVVEQIKYIAVKGSEMYSSVLEKLLAFKQQYTATHVEDLVVNMITSLKTENQAFREKVEQVKWRLTSPTLETAQPDGLHVSDKNSNKGIYSSTWQVENQIHMLKYHVAEAVQLWSSRLQDFVTARKKEEKPSSKILQTKSEEVTIAASFGEDSTVTGDVKSLGIQDIATNKNSSANQLSCCLNTDTNEFQQSETSNVSFFLQDKINRFHNFSWLERSFSCESVSEALTNIQFKRQLFKSYSEPTSLAYKNEAANNLIGDDVSSDCSSASSYTYGVTPGIYAGLMVPEPEDNESYVVCHKEHPLKKDNPSNLSRGHTHERSKSEGHQMMSESFSKSPQDQVSEENIKRDKKERTVKTLLSQFLYSTDVSLIQSPFPPNEHILPKGEKGKVPIIVYDDEPSSIIAYTLASSEYEQQLQEMRVTLTSAISGTQRDSQTSSPLMKRQNTRQLSENLSASDSPLPGDNPDFLDLVSCSSQETDKSGHKAGNKLSSFHLEIQFSDASAKFYCRVYYAEQFRKLRSLVFTEGEERFLHSLRHCIPWVARGGKSGSKFCKTRDDRFILKQMQKLELQSFLDLAPSYFQFINKAYVDQKPTLLAKIVGVYRIGYKNTVTNAASKMDLLVMENLFYGCNVTKKYDLKGSVRNRLVNTSGMQEDDVVLLDENLLKITCDNPLYIRPHSKSVLTSAIKNDTQFLSGQSVMDYSLLVGFDEEKTELIIGIIDYIRTFTWDKKVEMLVKSSGILGGHGKMPTVVSPELYRMRFCEAMDGYFLRVPDRWTHLATNSDI